MFTELPYQITLQMQNCKEYFNPNSKEVSHLFEITVHFSILGYRFLIMVKKWFKTIFSQDCFETSFVPRPTGTVSKVKRSVNTKLLFLLYWPLRDVGEFLFILTTLAVLGFAAIDGGIRCQSRRAGNLWLLAAIFRTITKRRTGTAS